MPIVGRLGQGVSQPRLDPFRAVAGDADRRGDGVGGLEADAPDIGGQPLAMVYPVSGLAKVTRSSTPSRTDASHWTPGPVGIPTSCPPANGTAREYRKLYSRYYQKYSQKYIG